jgi:predicted dehydrogenase
VRVAIIGAGLQGRRRAPVVRGFPETKLAVITAAQRAHAVALAERMACDAGEGWQEIVERPDIDTVIVCTPPHLHAEITIEALKAGKHVFCEKPIARTEDEARAMVEAAHRCERVLWCGFNHRYHPAVQQLRRWADDGVLGDLMCCRARYGICGRPGYEKEWRADPRVAAGGHLMEQGVHVTDLFRWFLGDPEAVAGMTGTTYWDLGPLEDNGFVLLRWPEGQIASLHSSLTQWRNLFSFEVIGRDGYAAAEGLGGGYGTERAILGKRDFDGPFAEQIIDYRGEDRSWEAEWKAFVAAVRGNRAPIDSAVDGLRALQIVNAAYASSREGRFVRLSQLETL